MKPSQAFFQTPSPAAHTLEVLRQLVPQAIETNAQGRIRVNAALLQLALDPANPAGIQVEEDGFELRWVGKREAYHSAFVPVQKIVQPLTADSREWDDTGHVLIKGDNSDALRLLRQSYFGKIKLIYIDPPYNTQSEAFIYRDDFSVKQSEVLAQLGYTAEHIDYIKNIYGARTHSGWLSFMYPRLLLAKDLLRDDGVIFISIDDNEQAPLKLLCDEVFGPENFVATLPWKKRTAKSDVPFGVSQDYEWLLAYAKPSFLAGQRHTRTYYDTPDFPNDRWRLADLTVAKTPQERPNSAFDLIDPKSGRAYPYNPKRVWAVTQDTLPDYLARGKIVFPGDYDFLRITGPAYRVFESEDRAKALHKHGSEDSIKTLSTQLPKEVGMSEHGNKDFQTLFEARYFSFPKPVGLLSYLFGTATHADDLILDFFAGSGTTGEAVMRLNAEDGGQRRFILVQMAQPIDAKKQKEAHHFVTHTLGKPEATIVEITAERLRRAGARLQAEQAQKAAAAGELLPNDTPPLDTGFRMFELVDDPDALILQRPLSEVTQADLLALQAHIATPQPQHLPRVLYNLLLAEGLPLSSRLETLKENSLYRAVDVVFVLQSVPLDELTDLLRGLQVQPANASTPPVRCLSIYAPWVADDNFMLGIHTVADALGFSEDKLRLRG